MIEKQTGMKIKELKIDNVEKCKNQFLQFGQNTGISTHFTNKIYGLTKKINRSFLEKVWCLFVLCTIRQIILG